MLPAPPVALTIAGFDPSAGAGMTADLKTFSAHGLYGIACMTATTVQSTMGVRSVHPQSPTLVRQTLECLLEDIAVSGVKIGMLGTGAIAGEVASFLDARTAGVEKPRLVLDPVIRSSSGAPLIDAQGIAVILNRLLPLVDWITPNLDELTILAGREGIDRESIDRGLVIRLANELKANAARLGNDELNIVVTGGHLHRPDDFLLTAAGEEVWFSGERIETHATHGTGCAFSSALLCEVIAGQSPYSAAAAAKSYVTEALRSAYPIGKGNGPLNHFFASHPNAK